jgi:Tol biopolymer transport system component
LTTSRRKFIKIGALVAGTMGLAACSKDDEPTEETTPETPVPVITGPTNLTIPKMGGYIEGVFDSKNSTGGRTSQKWKLLLPDSGIEEELKIGEEITVTHKFSRPGKYKIRLELFNNTKYGIAEQEVVVNPANFSDGDYEHPMLLMVNENISSTYQTIYLLYLSNMKMVRLFGSDEINGSRLSCDPTGRYILFAKLEGEMSDPSSANIPNCPIYKYDILSGELTMISQNPIGNGRDMNWSPNGNWIAYQDWSRFLLYSVPEEIALMKPDGTQRLFLSEPNNPDFCVGGNFSWNPDESCLAGGSIGFLDENLITIYKDLYSGNALKEYPFPSNDQIDRLYQSGDFGISREVFDKTLYAGWNGVSWSPDGEKILYDLTFGEVPDNYNLLVQSNTDLSGDIEILAMSKGETGIDFYLPHFPTWSRDGNTIYFIAYFKSVRHLYKMDPETKEKEMLLSSVTVLRPSLYS